MPQISTVSTDAIVARRREKAAELELVIQKNIAASILLDSGLGGLFRYGGEDVLRIAGDIQLEPVQMAPLLEQGLTAELARIFQTRIHADNFSYDRREKWRYWNFVERVGRVMLVERTYLKCCSKPIPMLWLVNEYPQDTLDTYHDFLARLIDADSPLYRRGITDALLQFILPASVEILGMDELVYLYIKLTAWQVHG